MNPRTITDAEITKFCTKVLPQFRKIMENLKELDHDLSPHEFGLHLMELGREQMSDVADPSEEDVELMAGYIESLDHNNAERAFFSAFAGGCILGLVIINEVTREDFGRALRLIEDFARKEFSRGPF